MEDVAPIADLPQEATIQQAEATSVPERPITAAEIPATQAVEENREPIQNQFLSEDNEFLLAKSFLTGKVGVKHPVSVYDHLTTVIMSALEQRNANIVDNFEQLSYLVKQNTLSLKGLVPTVKAVQESSPMVKVAKDRLELLQKVAHDEREGEIGDIPDIMELSNIWESGGVSFGKESTFALVMSIRKLVEQKHLKSVRLWGKIFGTEHNYTIVEAELKDGVVDEDEPAANAVQKEEVLPEETPKEEQVLIQKKVQYAPLSMEKGIGVNKYIYYVCQTIGGKWTRLPDVIPERLQESRKVRKLMTGNLNHKIVSYPAFKGNEAQYLRCMIARISATTVVSPRGYYVVDPEAEEPEEGMAAVPPIIINPEYEGLSNEQLSSPANWAHHVPYILPQGRAVWEQPKVIKEKGKETEEEEEEDEEENSAPEPESFPSPLSLLNTDEDVGNLPAWSARMCSTLSPSKFSPVMLRSNRWPGAYVFAYNDKFSNIYIGNGMREIGNPLQDFVPPPLGEIQKEYGVNDQAALDLLVEQVDPTVEAEDAFNSEHAVKEEQKEEEEEPEDEE